MDNKNIKILVVDDEPDIIEIISYNLKQQNYKVFSSDNGADSIKIAEIKKPDLIILDVMMPGMDGIQVCEKLRSKKTFNNTIIMFLSARGEEFTHLAAYEAGADDFVNKPVSPKLLVSKVKSLLRRLNLSNKTSLLKLKFKGLIIDKDEYTVKVKGQKLILPRKEFDLLFLLSSNPDKVIQREKISKNVFFRVLPKLPLPQFGQFVQLFWDVKNLDFNANYRPKMIFLDKKITFIINNLMN